MTRVRAKLVPRAVPNGEEISSSCSLVSDIRLVLVCHGCFIDYKNAK